MAYAQLLRETGRWDRLAEILSVPADTRPAPEIAPVQDARSAPQDDPAPAARSTPESTPAPDPHTPHPAEPVLTSLVLALLGDVASSEQKWHEARHWYRRALDAPGRDQAQDRARAALGTLPE